MDEAAEKVSVSLFPSHREIVATFAARERRTFSNALQVIIEEWAGRTPPPALIGDLIAAKIPHETKAVSPQG